VNEIAFTTATASRAPAEQALAALGEVMLLLDPAEGWMPWCTPAATRLLAPLGPGARLADVASRLAGLQPLLEARDPASAPSRLALRAGERTFDATVARIPPGRLALRLAEPAERGRALQRHLEDRERLLFTSRVISVGEMATTLAHELNQPIGAVVNLLRGMEMRLAREDSPLPEDLRRAVGRATELALFASRIIARIREYTQSRSPKRDPLDLARVVRASVQLLDWEVRRDAVWLDLDAPEDVPLPVTGDEVMLQQVFVNLVRNALDAMRELPAGAPRVLGVQARAASAAQVEVAISDTGVGLSDDAQARLFVPFASTKPSGMGIGLNICRSFVELHQGRLWFSRPASGGCAFHVTLPMGAAATAPAPAATSA
jgi:two-component system sensor histidine kinase DctS